MLHHGYPYTQVTEVGTDVSAYGVMPDLVAIHRVPGAELGMPAGGERSAYTLITLAACRRHLAESLPSAARKHHTAALAGVEELVGDQSLPEAHLITTAHQTLEVTYIAQLHISAILQVVPVSGLRSAKCHTGCNLPLELIAVLGLNVHGVGTLVTLDVSGIGSQTDVVPAVGDQLTRIDRLGLRFTYLHERQQVAYLIILQSAYELQFVQALHGHVINLEQYIAYLRLAQERQFSQRVVTAFVERNGVCHQREQFIRQRLKILGTALGCILGDLQIDILEYPGNRHIRHSAVAVVGYIQYYRQVIGVALRLITVTDIGAARLITRKRFIRCQQPRCVINGCLHRIRQRC